jgi:hypothetical protein
LLLAAEKAVQRRSRSLEFCRDPLSASRRLPA